MDRLARRNRRSDVLSLFHAFGRGFGCGVGGWLKEFERNGVADYLGVDGDYVARHLLKFRPIVSGRSTFET